MSPRSLQAHRLGNSQFWKTPGQTEAAKPAQALVVKYAVELPGCMHCFHEECIYNWLIDYKKECPTCKMPLQTRIHAASKPVKDHACDLVVEVELIRQLEEELKLERKALDTARKVAEEAAQREAEEATRKEEEA
jgi:hypothetical protein